jgi:ABC-2 type transport system permease protein
MKAKTKPIKQKLRIILAIAWKDILEGWKNKVVLTSVITALFLVIFYNYLPDLTRDNDLPTLVFLLSDSTYVEEIADGIDNFNIYFEEDLERFEYRLRDSETPMLGFILDKEVLASFDSANSLILTAHVPYWMNEGQIIVLQESFTETFSNKWQKELYLNDDINIIYPVMESSANGKIFIASAGLLLQIVLLGLSMAPQMIIEEKETRTLNAIMVSPATLAQFILGKSLAVLFYTILTTTIGLFFIGYLVVNWSLLIPSLLIGMFTFIIPGILVGTILETKQQISLWIWVLFIPTMLPMFLSIVRILPEAIMRIIDWWPTVVLSRLIQAGFSYQPPIQSFGWEALYLLLFVISFLAVTILVIRRKTYQ